MLKLLFLTIALFLGQGYLEGVVAKTYTAKEVQAHDTAKKPWVVYDGKVYNMKGFLKAHPGGKSAITSRAGTDVTKVFDSIHGASQRKTLQAFYIGDLKSGSKVPSSSGGGKGGKGEGEGEGKHDDDHGEHGEGGDDRMVTLNNLLTTNSTDIVDSDDDLGSSDGSDSGESTDLFDSLFSRKGNKSKGKKNKGKGSKGNKNKGKGSKGKGSKGMTYTKAEVAKHKSSKSLWVIYNGQAVDVTKFYKKHPGGPGILLANGGKDITSQFNSIHNSLGKKTIKKYVIGKVV